MPRSRQKPGASARRRLRASPRGSSRSARHCWRRRAPAGRCRAGTPRAPGKRSADESPMPPPGLSHRPVETKFRDPGSGVNHSLRRGSQVGGIDCHGWPMQDLCMATKTISIEIRSEEHTSELQSQSNLVCRLLLEKKKKNDLSLVNLYKYASDA